MRIAEHRIGRISNGYAGTTLDISLRNLVMNLSECGLDFRLVLLCLVWIHDAQVEEVLVSAGKSVRERSRPYNNSLAQVRRQVRSLS
jgi:hypothetical protein